MPSLSKVSRFAITLAPLLALFQVAHGAITGAETATNITISNDYLSLYLDKAKGYITKLKLGNQDLLGTGQGLYLDCYCIPTGAWTPGGSGATFELFQGKDKLQVPYYGVRMSHDYNNIGEVLSQYWFLRDGESGLHAFSRITYNPVANPAAVQGLQEFRTLFRPNNKLWTHLLSSTDQWAPLPGAEAISKQIVVQDATWSYNRTPSDPYVMQMSDYFTKYMFSEEWRGTGVWGMYSNGSTSADGSTYGAWLVQNTKDSYFNGPIHSDLTVDGIVYNYLVSNHHGDGIPYMTTGFERTFGPQYYYFNKGNPTDDIHKLRADAMQFYDPLWNTQFYDTIARHVPGYVSSPNRGKWHAKVSIPAGASNTIAILSANGVDPQDNNVDYKSYQYWAEVDPVTGEVEIDSIVAGTYRLTVYADGIFGDYVKDGIVVEAGHTAHSHVTFKEETAGDEIFRIGIPDKSSGEYLHGYAKDPTKPLHPAQHRLYWALHDFPTDFPNGVNYEVGKSDYSKDFNYVHWSVFGGYANSLRTQPVYDVNNWTVTFDITQAQVKRKKTATFTVQLAGVKTAAGNTDVTGQPYSYLPFIVAVNGKDLDPWIIPANQSSSCAVRSAVRCYNTAHKFVFGTELLSIGKNVLTLSLPYNATDIETAILPTTVYLQYDALRLEVD
ncbi:hypothetical protein H072_222 [Dactylellina haptotyla CBS 200.50]|uniref:Rhamnogalacturonan endolyase n=1 Tax=Dactylellina haptotyla (strain CBS 200.50) TaxID=1284197 RepID=S8AY01_DACHA|nr:hypothetical protein H072_222 [Dactylellina haptotyla CBS 200.50]